eukprot:CAMPEP_0197654108 /NCGR_PEP_ID=MMETSP1338-20131121/38657_1 /TAXON_ID=43686 ORGANISM="Pelagodinium beii, Strain RCC1491" /NCGR_SAMPLE_ID=MMETSP1338 /ASSEMBLY_ACC=CAM_ASM_000754 /LENGTH=193 /DNA_ID=CAMNT_0043229495 /DNA_START=109 /DNA_END=690 /DNA_ORIENTATION=+
MTFKIGGPDVKIVAGEKFVKLNTSAWKWIKLCYSGTMPGNPSLAGAPGLQKLIEMRNSACKPKEDQEQHAAAGALGFAENAENKKEKKKAKPALSRQQQKRLKDNPEVLTLVHGGDSFKLLRPVHPEESVWVRAEPQDIRIVVTLISEDLTEEIISKKREKAQAGSSTIKMGSGRTATKQADGTFKYIKKDKK